MNSKCCYVPTCSYDGFSSTHCLPKKDPQLARELLQGLGFADDYEPPPSFRVCRQHFTDIHFELTCTIFISWISLRNAVEDEIKEFATLLMKFCYFIDHFVVFFIKFSRFKYLFWKFIIRGKPTSSSKFFEMSTAVIIFYQSCFECRVLERI
jgi:hypothetical protein